MFVKILSEGDRPTFMLKASKELGLIVRHIPTQTDVVINAGEELKLPEETFGRSFCYLHDYIEENKLMLEAAMQ